MPADQRPERAASPGWSLNLTRAADGSVRIDARGEFDVAAVGEVRQAIATAVSSAPEPLRVLVDLSEVTFLDAAMLGVLVTERQSLQRDGRELQIIGVTPWTLRIIDICGLRETLGL